MVLEKKSPFEISRQRLLAQGHVLVLTILTGMTRFALLLEFRSLMSSAITTFTFFEELCQVCLSAYGTAQISKLLKLFLQQVKLVLLECAVSCHTNKSSMQCWHVLLHFLISVNKPCLVAGGLGVFCSGSSSYLKHFVAYEYVLSRRITISE